MGQVHKRFSNKQIKVPLEVYKQGNLSRGEIETTPGIGKTHFLPS